MHQLQTLPQNNESTVEGAARVARSWFMFGTDLVQQNDLQGCGSVWSLCCRAQQSCPAVGSRTGTHTSLAGVEQSELGLGGDSRTGAGGSSAGGDPGAGVGSRSVAAATVWRSRGPGPQILCMPLVPLGLCVGLGTLLASPALAATQHLHVLPPPRPRAAGWELRLVQEPGGPGSQDHTC